MHEPNLEDITHYIEENIGSFHAARADKLSRTQLHTILKRKNPYLFRAKNILTAQDLVALLLDAHLSSQEETMFGDFLEGLAIFICNAVYGGSKSSAQGIDLEFDKDSIHYIVAIKSGPNWANSSQITKMKDDFVRAARVLRTSRSNLHTVAINGCCYGKDDNPDKGEYHKLCGQRFWEFISGSSSLYTDIIEPLGDRARERNDEFVENKAEIINRFTREFADEFCDPSGRINWEKLVRFNSEARQ